MIAIILVFVLAILPIIGAVRGQAYRGAYLATALGFAALGGLVALFVNEVSAAAGIALSCWLIAFGCLVAAAAFRQPSARPPQPVSWFDANHPRFKSGDGPT